MNTQGSTPQLLTVADVANQLKLSQRTVYKLVSEGKLAVLRMGKVNSALRFRQQDIEAYLTSCEVHSAPIPQVRRPRAKPRKLKHLRINN